MELDGLEVFSPPFQARAAEIRDPKGSSRAAEADILTAVFDIEDNRPAAGAVRTQVIDQGSFRSAIAEGPLNPDRGLHGGKRQFLQDHGHAMVTGFVDSDYLLGYADGWQEVSDGLLHTGHFNLRTTRGAEMYERVKFSPDIIQASFRWPTGERVEMRSGREHVTYFPDVMESSLVGMGANFSTGIVAVRSAIEQLAKHMDNRDDLPKPEELKSWVGEADFRSLLVETIKGDEGLRTTVSEALGAALDEYAIKKALDGDSVLLRSIGAHIAELLKPAPPERNAEQDGAVSGWYGSMFERAVSRRVSPEAQTV